MMSSGARANIGKNYSITGPIIGEGSHGKVYPAKDFRTGQEVVVKLMPNTF